MSLFISHIAAAQPAKRFDIGNPIVRDLYVDPRNGDDSFHGLSELKALRTIHAAWNKIPKNAELTSTGYRITLLPGAYRFEGAYSNFYGDRLGTYQFPVIIRGRDGDSTVTVQGGFDFGN